MIGILRCGDASCCSIFGFWAKRQYFFGFWAKRQYFTDSADQFGLRKWFAEAAVTAAGALEGRHEKNLQFRFQLQSAVRQFQPADVWHLHIC